MIGETAAAPAASVAAAAGRRPGRTVILPPSLPARLVVSTPEWSREFPLQKDSVTLGREPDNDIVIEADVVSRHHAVLQKRGPDYLITDLGSTNGINRPGAWSRRSSSLPATTCASARASPWNTAAPRTWRPTVALAAAALPSAAAPAPGEPCAPDAPPPPVYDIPEGDALVLGRGAQTSVHLVHPQVSNVHAQVQRQAGQYVIRTWAAAPAPT